MKHLKVVDPEIYQAIKSEIKRQEENIELIASENFTSLAVLEAQGSVMTCGALVRRMHECGCCGKSGH